MIGIRGEKMDSNQLLNSKLLENCSVYVHMFSLLTNGQIGRQEMPNWLRSGKTLKK